MKTIIIDGIEYNLTPKVPFKKGDFVVIQETTYLISKIKGLNITLSLNGRECIVDIEFLKNAHLWTIQDAKDGDVLSFNDGHGNDCIELIKSITDKKIEFWFCLTNGNRYEVFDGITPYTNLASRQDATPATEEQCDTLYAKMKEAGYEWDAEKKELRKIEQKPSIEICPHSIKSKSYLETGYPVEQNPAWSEEDNVRFTSTIQVFEFAHSLDSYNQYGKKDIRDNLTWLKSLKERYTWKPSDEQMSVLFFYAEQNNTDGSVLRELYNDLKKLKR